MKVNLFDKRVLNLFYAFLSIVSVFTSIIFLFVDIDEKYKKSIGLVMLILIVVIYIIIWAYLNFRKKIKLKINSSEVEVKYGDIFLEESDLKVIAFNEYFDTLVDNIVISEKSLNGVFIQKFYKNNIDDLDKNILEDNYLYNSVIEENCCRKIGKKVKYKLGTICSVNDYLLMALTHFDSNNKAYLEINDYINCLLNFWNEVDRVYAGRTVSLPILGSGITRFKNYENISDQELLELMIWTFKVSRIKFTYPSKVKIIVFDDKKDKINLLLLKGLEK